MAAVSTGRPVFGKRGSEGTEVCTKPVVIAGEYERRNWNDTQAIQKNYIVTPVGDDHRKTARKVTELDQKWSLDSTAIRTLSGTSKDIA